VNASDGRLIVLVGPSGSGKTTLARALIGADPTRRGFSVSHTTRPRRDGERDGVDYSFVERARFEAMVQDGAFVEWAEVHGNLYGTSRAAITDMLAAGRDVLFDVDIQGAEAIYRAFESRTQLIFVVPPTWHALVDRLVRRKSESEQTLRRRLKTARVELARVIAESDRGVPWTCLVNDDLDAAREALESLVRSPRPAMTGGHRELLGAMLQGAQADPRSATA